MRRVCLLPLLSLTVASCNGGGLPVGWAETPPGTGPRVVWDLEAEPLPEIPLPNDVATWPDPTSPSGRRIDASLVAPSGMERRLRQNFDELDGWGTFAPLSVSFETPIDTGDLFRRQGRGQFSAEDWPRHAIYLINLETGVPVPLDVGSGLFPRVAAEGDAYYDPDPRSGESNILLETVDEDTNRNGRFDLGEDTDYDGILNRPNTFDGRLSGRPFETIDEMMWFYERETNTLVIRPILPLEESRSYAVVLTDRLVGPDGQPVRSPFSSVHHTGQYDELARLPERFAARPNLYGSLAGEGWRGVAFAWTFTTQSIRGDLTALRDGLYGRGPFSRLAEEFPAELVPAALRGGSRTSRCDPGPAVYTVTPAQLAEALDGLPVDDLGIPSEQLTAVLDALEVSVSHVAYGFFESPYLLGDPDAERVDDTWDLDRQTGEARVDRDLVPMLIVVPKTTETHTQPFPTTLYAHGYGTLNLEAIAFAAQVANHGVATVSINAPGHGIPLGSDLRPLLEAVLGTNCLAPLGRAIGLDRARDLNNDGTADSAGLFFSAYMFHTRDSLRQTALDWMQATRILRSWLGHPEFPEGQDWAPGTIEPRGRGEPFEFDGDIDGDGDVDRAGDFDGDGTPDLGGWDVPYRQWGSSLGGIVSMLNIGVEPAIVAAAPVSGGGGLFDIGMRTSLGTARHPVWLRVMGPLLVSAPSTGRDAGTACLEGERSVFFRLPDLNEQTTTEVACLPASELDDGDAVVLDNLRNGEVGCAGVEEGGRFRVAVPTDVGDPLRVTVLRGARDLMDYARCVYVGPGDAPVTEVVDTWRSANGVLGAACATCASYQGTVYETGSTLVAPAEGLGLARQSPDLRRLASLAQIALDPGDPINYARHVFLDPVTAPDVPERARSILVMNTAGDTTVPPATGNAYARAAGILAFMPADAPDDFADWRAPERFAETFGWASPDDVLIEHHVLEGIADLERHPVAGAPRFLFDVDDLSDGQQFFEPGGRRQLAESDGGLRPNRLATPLRWGRESRPAAIAPRLDPWTTRSTFPGVSLVLNAMTVPRGQHVLLPVDPAKHFDDGEYLLNVIGWYLASRGTEVPWVVLRDPFCLEDSSCPRD